MKGQFHITPKGQVRQCTAEKNCPYGGELGSVNHYNTEVEARQEYERRNSGNTLPVGEKKTRSSQEIEAEFLKLNQQLLDSKKNLKNIADEVRTKSDPNKINDWNKLNEIQNLVEEGKKEQIKIQGLNSMLKNLEDERNSAVIKELGKELSGNLETDEQKMDFAKQMVSACNEKIGEARSRAIANQNNPVEYRKAVEDQKFWTDRKAPYAKIVNDLTNKVLFENQSKNNDLIKDHSDVRVAHDVLYNWGAGRNKTYQDFFSMNVGGPNGSGNGTLNPITLEGSGDWLLKGDNDPGSLIICGNSNGGEARVIRSSGEFYGRGGKIEPELGRPIIQTKQGYNRDTQKFGLYVLGYVDTTGKSYGYIPNKKVSFFVFK